MSTDILPVLNGNGKQAIAHGSGQMRAQSISIQVSSRVRCNAGCKFCISRTTPDCAEGSGKDLTWCDLERLRVGLNYASHIGATHAILTGRADPTQETSEYLCELVKAAREHVPFVDMHTNGFLLLPGSSKAGMLDDLAAAGLTHLTLSIAAIDRAKNRELMLVRDSGLSLIRYAVKLGLLVRASLVVNKSGVCDVPSLIEYIWQAGEYGAHMVVVREVWVPEVYSQINEEVYAWNRENYVDIKPLQDEFMRLAEQRRHGLRRLNDLPWGTPVFAMEGIFESDPSHGVNVTFARCDEANVGSVMKSIVHRPNGHGYRNWDSMGDILY